MRVKGCGIEDKRSCACEFLQSIADKGKRIAGETSIDNDYQHREQHRTVQNSKETGTGRHTFI